MYTEEMLESIKKVEAKRAENAAMEPRRMTAEEKDQVLKENHLQFQPVISFSCHLAFPSALNKRLQHTSVNDVMIAALSIFLDGISNRQPLLSHQKL